MYNAFNNISLPQWQDMGEDRQPSIDVTGLTGALKDRFGNPMKKRSGIGQMDTLGKTPMMGKVAGDTMGKVGGPTSL